MSGMTDMEPSIAQFDQAADGSFLEVSFEQVVDDTRFKCDLCTKTYLSKDSLQRHMKSHRELRPFCSLCTQCFGSEVDLAQHKTQKHKSTHLCTVCAKMLSTRNNLKEHMKLHGGNDANNNEDNGRYLCRFGNCGKRFSRLVRFQDHMNIHAKVSPYACKSCKKKFTNRYKKSEHERVCSGKTEIKCETCGANFSDKQALLRHKQSQHLKRKHVCECGKIYKYYSSLFKHKKTKQH